MARVEVDSGICGFTTLVVATSEDQQHVSLHVTSTCPHVSDIAEKLNSETFDAFEEIGPCEQPISIYQTHIMGICRSLPHAACPVPSGVCKALEVAAGLALPRDAHIKVSAGD